MRNPWTAPGSDTKLATVAQPQSLVSSWGLRSWKKDGSMVKIGVILSRSLDFDFKCLDYVLTTIHWKSFIVQWLWKDISIKS